MKPATDFDPWAATCPAALEPAQHSPAPPHRQDDRTPDLLERLSSRLLSDFPVAAWHKVFLTPAYETIRFRRGPATLLCTASLGAEWSQPELAALAARCSGHLESFAAGAMLSFGEACDALDAALLLQRASERKVRTALLTADFTAAYFELDGAIRRLTLDPAPAAALALVERATPGSIQLSGETFEELSPALESKIRDALLTTEVQDGVVLAASITLPPPPRAALSTFAGLGLT